MSKLYFYYGAMNGSKTTQMVQNAYNYQERKMRPVILKPSMDTREGEKPRVVSRIGAEFPAVIVESNNEQAMIDILKKLVEEKISVVMVDEAQFFSVEQMIQLENFVDDHNIPVMCYGLRNSFNSAGFPSIDWLLRNADKLVEIKNICFCGKKATHNLMVVDGQPVKCAESAVKVGGNELYHAVCRKHFKQGVWE